ncbi:MAG: response regulator [Candidatus Eisenbacteria bacterium]
MKWLPPSVPQARPSTAPLVLVADDDPRVIELLHLTLTSHHMRVVTALDGDEAIRRALAERPDLVVLDTRMPGKNGLEVCDWLRHDPEDPHVPVVLLADAPDGEMRLEAFARGADDVLVKPFSPREFVARLQRLLARSRDAREQRRHAQRLERELQRAQDDSRRAAADLRREQRLRELAFGLGRDLQRSLDPDEVAAQLLAAAQRLLGCERLVLFAPEAGWPGAAPLRWQAYAGADPGGFDERTLRADGELVALVSGLGRPVRRGELERLPAVAPELAPFVTLGAAVFAPVRTRAGLEALLVADERADGLAYSGSDLEMLGALAQLAAPALQNAWRHRAAEDRALELLAERAMAHARARHARDESREHAARMAAALGLPARERALAAHAVALGAWAWDGDGRAALGALAAESRSPRLLALAELVERASSLDLPPHLAPELREATLLAAVVVRAQVARTSGRSREEAWSSALGWVSAALDPRLHEAFAASAHVRGPGRAHAHPGPELQAA